MTQDARTARRLHRSISIASALLAALIFVADLQYPPGRNVPALYILPLVLSLWQLHGRDTFIAAAGCSGLTVLGLLLSPPGGDWSTGVVNRVFVIFGLLVTAFLVARFKQTLRAQQQIGARLRDNEALIEQSQQVAHLGSCEIAVSDSAVDRWSAEAFRILELDPARGPLRPDAYIERVVHADDRELVRRQFQTAVRTGARFDEHYRIVTPDRRLKHVHSVAEPILDSDGRVTQLIGTIQDVTDRIDAGQAARLRDARIRAILETAVDAILVIDTHGIIQLANPAIERLFGYAPDELIGRNVSMLMPSPDGERHDGHIARYLATGEKRIIGIGREVLGLRKDGSTIPVSLSVSEMKVEGEHTFTGMLHDLTERKRIEAQLRERADLARLGQMASVVAHEVRNPLAGIRGALQVIGTRMPADSRDRAVMHDVVTRLDALNQFVDDLLVFSRPKPPDLSRTTLTPVFQRLVELLQRDPQFSGVTFELEAADISVDIDQRQMERALLNLLTNAAQAMKGTGRVHIAVEATGYRCRISIADTGPGVPPDVREKMFEPFFTTKHRGTGLGLSITKRTIEQHGGSVAVHGTPGGGTTIVVDLQIARPEIPNPFALGEVEEV